MICLFCYFTRHTRIVCIRGRGRTSTVLVDDKNDQTRSIFIGSENLLSIVIITMRERYVLTANHVY